MNIFGEVEWVLGIQMFILRLSGMDETMFSGQLQDIFGDLLSKCLAFDL